MLDRIFERRNARELAGKRCLSNKSRRSTEPAQPTRRPPRWTPRNSTAPARSQTIKTISFLAPVQVFHFLAARTTRIALAIEQPVSLAQLEHAPTKNSYGSRQDPTRSEKAYGCDRSFSCGDQRVRKIDRICPKLRCS